MADARETLEMMREVARTRIAMLRDGITFYDNDRRSYYLRQYEEKLTQIEHLIRRISIRLVEPPTEETP
ncbi:hypothetical protein KI811_03875 [Geobacter hydrogenophilus]|uniref:Uncharacterized protein n=1 Tax=Geobacter hydrogenophilus TaxID=40983 RepID=A0A9W6G2G0_9BACT|nr:hypothetical protein [Geobacter hydrogenophilus]MBT0892959.1 hypothetical protein [Geobacter hydrogenophilus]GLI39205.1 hypothetical protein GHYDROH2_27060 [Geobacter hydrogenophilus]